MDQQNTKLPNINNRGSSQGIKRQGSFMSVGTGNAKSAFIAKKERKE